jgi:hypothetical protein
LTAPFAFATLEGEGKAEDADKVGEVGVWGGGGEGLAKVAAPWLRVSLLLLLDDPFALRAVGEMIGDC